MLESGKSILVGDILIMLVVLLAEVIVGNRIDCQSALAGRSHMLVSQLAALNRLFELTW